MEIELGHKGLTIGSINFDNLFKQYYAPMVLYADSRLNDREQAEDAVQDVFSKLLETSIAMENDYHAKNYLYMILKNKIIDIFRYRQRHQLREIRDTLLEDSADDSLFELDIYERLYKEVELLPIKVREAMELRMQGYDNHEIAQMLNVNYHTVRSRMRKGIYLLRGKFDKGFLYSIFL